MDSLSRKIDRGLLQGFYSLSFYLDVDSVNTMGGGFEVEVKHQPFFKNLTIKLIDG